VKKPSRIFRSPYSTAGSGDAAPCRISARVSKDRGRTWSGKITLQENFGVDNVKHPNLLRLPSGEILFSFTVRDIANRDLKIYLKRSRDECETWTEPVQISPTGGVYFTNADHNLLHSSGRIILPCHWGEFYGRGDHYNAFCLYSDDEGETWRTSRKRVDLPKRGAEEPGVVELKDGSLLSMMRTTLGKIYRSTSKDRGETWSNAEATELPSPSAANCIKRIPKTGDLVFVWNNATPEALTVPGGTSYHYPRNPLTAAISKDEGKTWTNLKDIERREGYISGYPSISFVGGEALVAYYHSSRSMSRDTDLRLKIFDVDWFYS
jgi:sialidase-1